MWLLPYLTPLFPPASLSLSLSLNCGGWSMNTGSVCNNVNYPPSCMTFHTHRWLYFIYTSCPLDYFNMPLGFPLDTSLLNIRTFWISNTDIFPYMDFFLTFKIFLILWAFFVFIFIIIIQIFCSYILVTFSSSPSQPNLPIHWILCPFSLHLHFFEKEGQKARNKQTSIPIKTTRMKIKTNSQKTISKNCPNKAKWSKTSTKIPFSLFGVGQFLLGVESAPEWGWYAQWHAIWESRFSLW